MNQQRPKFERPRGDGFKKDDRQDKRRKEEVKTETKPKDEGKAKEIEDPLIKKSVMEKKDEITTTITTTKVQE